MKVLAVSPYKGLNDIIKDQAKEYPDLQIDAIEGNLDRALEVINNLGSLQYDVIISRGGTAEAIASAVTIPVVNITFSVFDFIRAIKLSKSYGGKSAVVGFPYITKTIETLKSEIEQENIDIFTCPERNDIDGILSDLKKNGYKTVIGDVFACQNAEKAGFNTVFIASGKESVVRALEDAQLIYESNIKSRQENSILKEIILSSSVKTVVISKDKGILFSNNRKPDMDSSELISVGESLNEIKCRFILKENSFWKVTRSEASFLAENYYILRFSNSDALLNVFSNVKVDSSDFSVFNNILLEKIPSAGKFAGKGIPVFISSPSEQDNDRFASAVNSLVFKRDSYWVIDFASITEDKTESVSVALGLLADRSFPSSVYIRNIERVKSWNRCILEKLKALFERKEILLLCIFNNLSEDNQIASSFVKHWNTPAFEFSLLSENADYFYRLSAICINVANVKYGKQVTSVSEEGIRELKSYRWIGSLSQFDNVIERLVQNSKTGIISEKEVACVLTDENFNSRKTNALDTSRTLDELEEDYIGIILKEENNNYSKVAQRLGIGRSTLWRKIKNLGPEFKIK